MWAHPPAVSRLIAADLVSSQAGTEILKTGLSWVSVFETNLSSIQFRYDIKTWINDAQVNKERIHKPILGILFWERIGRLCLDTYSVQHGVLCYVNQCLWRRWLRQFSNQISPPWKIAESEKPQDYHQSERNNHMGNFVCWWLDPQCRSWKYNSTSKWISLHCLMATWVLLSVSRRTKQCTTCLRKALRWPLHHGKWSEISGPKLCAIWRHSF